MPVLGKPNILIIGDLMIDHYTYGTVSRICPEAPVPVLEYERDEFYLGGAGLVAATLRDLGAIPFFLSVTGSDEPASLARKLLQEKGIPDLLVSEPGRPTTLKHRFFATRPYLQMLLRTDHETRTPIASRSGQQLLAQLDQYLPQADFVLVSDYNKGLLTPALVTGLLERCRSARKPVAVDTKRSLFDYKGVDAVVPNVHELLLEYGEKYSNEDDVVVPHARKLAKTLGSRVIVKRGSQGATLVENDKVSTLPSAAPSVLNVSGAGDIFLSVLSIALASGYSYLQATQLANRGCGIAIGRPHPALRRDDLP